MKPPQEETRLLLFFGLPCSLWITCLLLLHVLVVGITIMTMKMPIYSMSSGGDTTTRGSQSTNTNSKSGQLLDDIAATLLFQIISNSTRILYNDEEFLHYLDGGADPESLSTLLEAEAASSLYVSSLPQYQSLQWLLHDDEYIHQKLQLLQMNDDDGDDMNVGSDDIDDKHLRRTVLERYVLGVVYYSSNANKATVVAASSRSSVTETIPASSSRRRSSMDKSWLLKSTNLSVCEWYGVECNDSTTSKEEGRNNDDDEVIIGLDLAQMDLTGSIPKEIVLLRNLTYLDLSGNHLSGTIPSQIYMMQSSLSVLSLWNNDLTGTIPTEMSHLTHLKRLYLDGNPDLRGNLNPMFCTSSSTSTSTGGRDNSIQEYNFPDLYDIRSDCATSTNAIAPATTKGNVEEGDEEDGGDDGSNGKTDYLRPNVLCDCCLKCY